MQNGKFHYTIWRLEKRKLDSIYRPTDLCIKLSGMQFEDYFDLNPCVVCGLQGVLLPHFHYQPDSPLKPPHSITIAVYCVE